jgi:hypothetical protein
LQNKVYSTTEKKIMIQTIEIFNGRMAMLATVGFVFQEYFSGFFFLKLIY